MKRAILLLALAASTPAQDLLPPGVLQLSRIRRHVKEELARLPNISCLETLQREYQPAGGKLRSLDTVRLEVLTDGHKELFAAPGERKFSEQHPIEYVGSGVIGDGFFGLFLKEVLVDGSVSYEYKGPEEIAGRRLERYDYRLPVSMSGHTIRLQEGGGAVGMHGSFWADAGTYDVIRLEMNADDFPPTLPLTEAVTIVNYAVTALGESRAALLPESAEFRMTRFSGEMNRNHIDFTHCRLYGAESTISFAPAGGAASEVIPRFGASSIDDTLRPLPAGLQIAVRLTSRVAGDAPVGTLIEGVVAGNVSAAKGPVVIAAGAKVRGRIRRLERYSDPEPHFVVAMEFTELESEGIRYRFYADFQTMDAVPGIEERLATVTKKKEVQSMPDGSLQTRQSGMELYLPALPGVANFFVRGTNLELPQGFRTVWKTRPVAP